MVRKIIHIDEDACNGCGLCVTACHEGAIALENGKAKLMCDDYCDGLGDCLPACPTGAISFVEREAVAYNEAAVQAAKTKKTETSGTLPCGCPGTHAKAIYRNLDRAENKPVLQGESESQLRQWPVQIKLVPVTAPYFKNAHLLIAADCTAYAYGNFHKKFMRNKICIVGCPKLDAGDYSEKLSEIIKSNDIKSVTIVKMEVPCCGGLEQAGVRALQNSGKFLPWQVITITTDGKILE